MPANCMNAADVENGGKPGTTATENPISRGPPHMVASRRNTPIGILRLRGGTDDATAHRHFTYGRRRPRRTAA